jgi:threonylcarbamoyladenosine tRNA methylthiotransferase CDKAL1
MKVYIKEFNSCVMRKQKIQQYRNFFLGNGHQLVSAPEEGDITIIWTCGFRGDFRDGSVLAIENLRGKSRGKVLVTGCLPNIAPASIPVGEDVLVIPWRQDEEAFSSFFMARKGLRQFDGVFCEGRRCEDTAQYRLLRPEDDCTFHDQFIKLVIAEGCLFACSYCSERLAFPAFKSFPAEELVTACRSVVEQTSVYDVMLMADSLGQYGKDINSSLPELMQQLLDIHPKLTLALNNLNPANFIEFEQELADCIRDHRIKHLNLPIQSASDSLLRAMSRPYGRNDLDRMYDLLQQLDFHAHDTHIIVGFPGETEEDIEETIRFLARCRPRYSLVSMYMEASGAPASLLPGKVDQVMTYGRIARMTDELTKLGIICNADGSDLSMLRLRLLAAKV